MSQNRNLALEYEDLNGVYNIVLLGPTFSGKTTLFKELIQITHETTMMIPDFVPSFTSFDGPGVDFSSVSYEDASCEGIYNLKRFHKNRISLFDMQEYLIKFYDDHKLSKVDYSTENCIRFFDGCPDDTYYNLVQAAFPQKPPLIHQDSTGTKTIKEAPVIDYRAIYSVDYNMLSFIRDFEKIQRNYPSYLTNNDKHSDLSVVNVFQYTNENGEKCQPSINQTLKPIIEIMDDDMGELMFSRKGCEMCQCCKSHGRGHTNIFTRFIYLSVDESIIRERFNNTHAYETIEQALEERKRYDQLYRHIAALQRLKRKTWSNGF
jgi:energy-coupling factor transporter ATP-binding protein EcfA2